MAKLEYKIPIEQLYEKYDNAVWKACLKEIDKYNGGLRHIILEDFHQDAWLVITQFYGAVDTADNPRYLILKQAQKRLEQLISVAVDKNKVEDYQRQLAIIQKEIGYDLDKSEITSWIINVVHTVALQYARSKAAKKRDGFVFSIEDMEEHHHTIDDLVTPSHELSIDCGTSVTTLADLDPRVTKRLIRKALKQVKPEKYSKILHQIFFQKQTEQDIAREFHVKLEFILTLKKKALALLRIELEKELKKKNVVIE